MKNIDVLVVITDGTEESEAIIVADILRRAGINVTLAGTNSSIVSSHKIKIIPDVLISELDKTKLYDAIVIPGGKLGTENLFNNSFLADIIQLHNNHKRFICAICAAPIILAKMGLIKSNHYITCHPSVKEEIPKQNYQFAKVVISDNFITSSGAGNSFDFAFTIIKKLIDSNSAEKIKADILFN